MQVTLAYNNIPDSDDSYEIIQSQLGAANCDYYFKTYGYFRRDTGFDYRPYKNCVYEDSRKAVLLKNLSNVFDHLGKSIAVEIILFAGKKTCQAFYIAEKGVVKVFADIALVDMNSPDLQNAVIHELIHGVREVYNLVPDDSLFKVCFIEEAVATYYARYFTSVQNSSLTFEDEICFEPLVDELKKVWHSKADDIFYTFFCKGVIKHFSIPGLGYAVANYLMESYIDETGKVNVLEENSYLENTLYKRIGRGCERL